MRQLQLIAHGEPSEFIELNTVFEPVLGQEEVLVSMEAAPLNPSDFTLVRGIYGVRPALPFSMGSEGVGRVVKTGSKVDAALQGKRVLILPTYEQGTWADQVVLPVRNIVPMSDEADPLQLSMIGINPATAYLLLNRYVSLMPGDWIGQTAANSAMGQYIIALAKLAGVKTLNVVRREEAAEQVRQFGGNRVVIQGDNLHKDIEEALDGKKLSLVLDTVGGTPVGEFAKSLKNGGSIVVYALQSGQLLAFSPRDFIYRGLSLHGFWLINWIRNAPRTESQEIYQKLGDLVADGSLSAAVEHVYPLEQFK
jgi:NADPH:quinone reductase-like Zn-dependent oxidoreductase